MKALVLEDYKKFTLVDDYAVPALADNELLVRVHSCGICGSDVHGYDGSSGRRIPPVIMGHEAAGIVAQVGSAVTRFREGDRVTFDSMISCGKCYYCRRGRPNLCDDRRVLGVSCGEYTRNGAFAEFVNVPEHIVYSIPEGLSFDHAAMVEPVSVAVHAVDITPLQLGDSALVVGAGMIGLLTLQALRTAGCGKIIVTDLADDRLELARKLGADEVVNSGNTNVADFVKQHTEGRGVDVALEAVGATPTVKMCLDSVRKGGAVTLIGNITPTVELGLQSVVTREITVYGSCASANDYPACLELMARGAIKVDPMISATGPLETGPDFFARLYGREPNLTKVILNP
ncbi:MAG: galactitol-1-phosphate 5-dehydrogenase [Bryobacterales bacterium]|nr:galactitol-1-phosphate 5-dehydrogenase [Bryobacterales bacterium]